MWNFWKNFVVHDKCDQFELVAETLIKLFCKILHFWNQFPKTIDDVAENKQIKITLNNRNLDDYDRPLYESAVDYSSVLDKITRIEWVFKETLVLYRDNCRHGFKNSQ